MTQCQTLTEIMLFPLHAVLVPGGVLTLRIFEPRYLRGIKMCMRTQRPFGVVCITSGDEVITTNKLPEYASIGTLAYIEDFDTEPGDLLKIRVQGHARFRVERPRATDDKRIYCHADRLPRNPRMNGQNPIRWWSCCKHCWNIPGPATGARPAMRPTGQLRTDRFTAATAASKAAATGNRSPRRAAAADSTHH